MTTRTIAIDKEMIGTLTVAELELLEDRTGRPLSRLFDADAPRGSLLHSLAYIVLRREAVADGLDRDSVTWEDAGDTTVALDATEVGTTGEGPTLPGRRRRAA